MWFEFYTRLDLVSEKHAYGGALSEDGLLVRAFMFEKQCWNGRHFVEGLKLRGILNAFQKGDVLDIDFIDDIEFDGQPSNAVRA